MSLSAREHSEAAKADINAGEITIYRLNKATYDAVHYVHESGYDVVVTRNGKPLVRIVSIDSD